MALEDILGKLSEEERQEILGEFSKKNSEAKGLRERAKRFEAWDAKMKAELGKDAIDDSDIESLLSATKGNQSTAQQLEALRKKAEQEALAKGEALKELEGLKTQTRNSARDAQILEVLGGLGIRSEAVSAAAKLIASEAEYDADSSKWTFAGKTLATFAKEWAAKNPYMLSNPTKPGAGKTGPTGGATGVEMMSREDYMALPQAERIALRKDKAKFDAMLKSWQ